MSIFLDQQSEVLQNLFFIVCPNWGQKKVVLFPEIGRVKFFLSFTRLQMSNVYENIYILFQKYTHTNKKNSH